MKVFANPLDVPWLWDRVQDIMGAPGFKRALYRSKLHPPGRLLDFGCATGHLSDTFVDFDYYGLDLDPNAIAYATSGSVTPMPVEHAISSSQRTSTINPFAEDSSSTRSCSPGQA